MGRTFKDWKFDEYKNKKEIKKLKKQEKNKRNNGKREFQDSED